MRITSTIPGDQQLLDRMAARRNDADWLSAKMGEAGARFIVLSDLKPVVRSNEARDDTSLAWFSAKDIAELRLPISDALFLGVDRDKNGVFAICVPEHTARLAPGGVEKLRPAVDLRTLAIDAVMSQDELTIVSAAKSLWAWHLNARHCGHCGGTTRVKDGGWKRKCWACGQEWFPRTDPVAIMLITFEDRCLLGHQHGFGDNMYSALAGFVEHGEDIETAVRREIMEEAGIKVGAVRYATSQSWPFPHSLMIGCHGEALTSEITIDAEELTDAQWFTRDDVTQMMAGAHSNGLIVPGKYAIANWLLEEFIARRR